MLRILKLKSLPTEIIDTIHIKENKEKEHYEYSFEYYTPKEFKDLCEVYESKNREKLEALRQINPDATKDDVRDWIHTEDFIIGNVSLKDRKNNNDVDNWDLEHPDEDLTVLKMDILRMPKKDYEQYDSYFTVKSPMKTDTFGFVRVGQYEYIRIEEGGAAVVFVKGGQAASTAKRIVKFVVFTAILSYIVGAVINPRIVPIKPLQDIVQNIHDSVFPDEDNPENPTNPDRPDNPNSDKEIGEGEDWNGELEKGGKDSEKTEMEYIDIAGYAELYANPRQQAIRLINMGTAKRVYMEYDITLEMPDGTVKDIYKTKLIKPGQETTWNMYESLTEAGLEDGKYYFTFSINNYDINADGSVGEALDGATEKVDITYSKE